MQNCMRVVTNTKGAMTLLMVLMFNLVVLVGAAFAATPTTAATAAAAESKAHRAEGSAAAATAEASKAKADASIAGSKADKAKELATAAADEAVAVGTKLREELGAKESQLRAAVSAARGAAASGDRALERTFNSKVSAIKAEIEELKTRTQHECGAFRGDSAAVTACLKSAEAIAATNAAVTTANITAKKEVAIAHLGVVTSQVDLVKSLESGCSPQTTIAADGTTTVVPVCGSAQRGRPINYSFRNIGGASGVIDMKVEQAGSPSWAPVAIGALTGAVAGGALGYGLFPNRETLPNGETLHRPYTGLIGGAGLGALTGALTGWLISKWTD